MNTKHIILTGMACAMSLALVSVSPLRAQTGDAKSKEKGEGEGGELTIEEIMEKSHKGKDSIVKRVVAGTATEDEMKTLIGYYLAMEKMEAPKGDAASWKEKTAATSKAAILVFAKADGAQEAFKTATDCKACHKEHKPD